MAGATFDAHVRFLRATGVEGIEHDSHAPFLSHLVGVARLLESWGARPALCTAGLFHSVYGTEYFAPELASTPERDEVVAQIGAEAERVAWLWCSVQRESLACADGRGSAKLRRTGETLPLSEGDLRDVTTLWMADAVEQFERLQPEERGTTVALERLSSFALAPARAAFASLRNG